MRLNIFLVTTKITWLCLACAARCAGVDDRSSSPAPPPTHSMHLDPQGSIEGVFWRAHFSSRACVPYLNKLATSKFVSLPDLWDSTCRRKLPSHFTLMKHFTLFLALAVGLGALIPMPKSSIPRRESWLKITPLAVPGLGGGAPEALFTLNTS